MMTSLHICTEKQFKNGKWTSLDWWTSVDKGGKKVYYKKYWDGIFPSMEYAPFIEFMTGKGKEGFGPIVPLRGLPDDVSPKVKSFAESWGEDAHSHSWIGVAELLAFDWSSMATRSGYLTLSNYLCKDSLTSWKLRVDPAFYDVITEEDMQKLVEDGESPEDHDRFCCLTTWKESYADMFPWLQRDIEQLLLRGDADRLRLVTWLDN